MRAKAVNRRSGLILWQAAFLLLGSTWLWAPYANHVLNNRLTLISQYEIISQPYSLFFRTGDILAGILLLGAAMYLLKTSASKLSSRLILAMSVGMILDPMLQTTCHLTSQVCQEYFSFGFALHALETLVTATAFLVLAVFDAWRRKQLVSIALVIFQIAYGLLFISRLADRDHFNTLSQYIYQLTLIVWIAWYVRDSIADNPFKTGKRELNVVKNVVAVWAFMNGILAITLSLAHIHVVGKLRGLYFAGDNAWLAQHGVIIGVIMLYLSRHLFRGELRARQLFLLISGVETLKYSVISPHPGLLLLYVVTFCGLFVLRDDFTRGTIPMTWQIRLKDLYFMVGGLLAAMLAALLLLDRDSRASVITSRMFDNFFDYAARTVPITKPEIPSVLLAHTISAFLLVSAAAVLWILFRPYKNRNQAVTNHHNVVPALSKYSRNSEDYFKLWPSDKSYFTRPGIDGFIAYKPVGAVVFAVADPITAPKQQQKLLNDFITENRQKRLKTCFLPVAENSMELYKNAGLELLQIGSSAIIDNHAFLSDTASNKWWRWQKNRATKQGYQYEYSKPPHSTDLLKQLRMVSDAWLDIDGHIERGFALGYFNETYLQACAIHYIRDSAGRVVAFTNQLPQFQALETATVDLLRYQPDCNHAMPYLLLRTIKTVTNDDPACRFFDLGFVPFARAKGPLLSAAKIFSGDRFSYSGLEQFKNKFKPQWRPNYIAYDGDLGDLTLVAINLEKAMDPDFINA